MMNICRRFHSSRLILGHENPLGLPRKTPQSKGLPIKQKIPQVNKTILVASGKGGVGKSTVSINLALSLLKHGLKVGVLDADIFGPSIPKLMNLSGEPRMTDEGKLIPLTNYGIPTMSMGFLIPSESSAIVWRGLMVMKALQQLLFEVHWGGLDVLVIDTPPGTGDTHLSLSQQVKIDGAVVVSTPQDIALADVRKGLTMFEKVKIPVLGLVQNMSYYLCPNCHHESHVFGTDGVRKEAEKNGVDWLGDIPLNEVICEQSDIGKPVVVSHSDSEISKPYMAIAGKIKSKLF